MYLRVSKQKRADGTVIAHYQLAESVWDKDKKSSRTKILYNFGRAHDQDAVERLRKLAHSIIRRCDPETIIRDAPDWRLVDSWPFGPIFVLEALWERLGIKAIINEMAAKSATEFSIERAVFAMVANRAIAPASKLYCWQQWLAHDVRITGTDTLSLHHLYRAMDWLEAHKDELEKAIFFQLADLLNLDVDIIFYDTTSLYFEIDDNDQGDQDDIVKGNKASGAKDYKAPRKRGYSKDGRGDAPQVVVGLAVTRDGLPVRHWVWPGNTVDVTTVKQVKAELRGWKLGRCVFVGDAGMVSKENLRTLAVSGGKYIVSMPLTKKSKVAQQVLGRAGRYQEVADNLKVKEVTVGDGERRQRYVLCHNPQEQKRACRHRARVLKELEAELASLQGCKAGTHSKRVCQLKSSRRYGRYLRETKRGKLRIDRAAVKEAARFDGKFVVHSNDDTLSAEDLALGYKQLMRVEMSWRALKSGLCARPIFHHAPHRIHAHIYINILALLVERVCELDCKDTWRNIRDDLGQIKLAQLLGPKGTVWQVTEAQDSARKRLKSLKINNPPTLLDWS